MAGFFLAGVGANVVPSVAAPNPGQAVIADNAAVDFRKVLRLNSVSMMLSLHLGNA